MAKKTRYEEIEEKLFQKNGSVTDADVMQVMTTRIAEEIAEESPSEMAKETVKAFKKVDKLLGLDIE